MRSRRWSLVYARLALGAAFLNGIASRFGWYGKDVGYGNYANFVTYTAQVNAFMPAWSIPFLAAAATVAELVLGILLVAGVWPKWVAIGSAVLLAIFGTAMAISMGPVSPLDYSVFSASAAAVMLAVYQPRSEEQP
jgi:putative oxidoreductase